jgi:hypothetical protein
MQPLRAERSPTEAARDLLGLGRALYVAAGPGSERRAALTSIGVDLVLTIDNARAMPFANTPQQATAWFVAERAFTALGVLMAGNELPLRPVLEAAIKRAGFGK